MTNSKTQGYSFYIPENASSEVLVWYPYPEVKPEKDGDYLVQFKMNVFVICEYYVGNKDKEINSYWLDTEGYMYSTDFENIDEIIAWAEMPDGYKED